MSLKLAIAVFYVAVTIALAACGGANEEVYNDRKIYIYTDEPSSGKRSADATASTSPQNSPPNPSATPGASTEKGGVVASGGLVGALDTVSSTGKVTGWAALSQDASVTVNLKITVDGKEEAAALAANIDGFDDNTPGAHAFMFDLPESWKDGNDHELQVTAFHGSESLIFNRQVFKLSGPSQAGRSFFATNLQATLQTRCGSCHSVNYMQQYASLSTPLPNAGGTITNNELINMASGRNGNVNHPGGNICGNKNSGVCAVIQQWWTAEFRNP